MKHVNQNLSVRSTEIFSTQEWTCDPDLIEVYFSGAFLEKAQACVDFMQALEVHQVKIWFAFSYGLFQNLENVDEEGVPITVQHNSKQYVVFEPEYRLDGCHAQIDRDGDIRAEFPFKYTSNKLWAEIGNLKDLKAKLVEFDGNAEASQVQPALTSDTPVSDGKLPEAEQACHPYVVEVKVGEAISDCPFDTNFATVEEAESAAIEVLKDDPAASEARIFHYEDESDRAKVTEVKCIGRSQVAALNLTKLDDSATLGAATGIHAQEVTLQGANRSPARLIATDGVCLAMVYLTDEKTRRRTQESEEYARRLEACWNVCVGMSTEDVESWAAENKRKRAALEADEASSPGM